MAEIAYPSQSDALPIV